MTTPNAIDALRDARTIAVVGLDSRTDRVAYRIAVYLQHAGYTIIPVHRGRFPAETVLGEAAYESLRDVPGRVDLVDVFVRSEETGPVIDDAIAIKAGAVWLQQAIYNGEGLARAQAAGLATIEDACTMVEHQRLRWPR
jgi:predicted CoA-binding protein